MSAQFAAAADPFTTTDAITLIVAITGAVTGIASLTVTVFQHYLAGPRIAVEVVAARLGPVGRLHGGSSWNHADAETLARHPVPAVAVYAVNRGRMPTMIETWGVEIGDGLTFQPLDMNGNPELPARIEAGQRLVFFCDLERIIAGNQVARAQSSSVSRKARGRITLGDGRIRRSRQRLALPSQ